MTTSPTTADSARSNLRWWRDWLLLSIAAVFVVSLVAAQLPPSLRPIVIFPIGLCIVAGLAIRKCRELVGDAGVFTRSARFKMGVAVIGLLLAGVAHTYWIVFDRYLDDAREHREQLEEERRERAQIVQAIANQGEQLDQAGVAAVLQPLPPLPTFIDYLQQRVRGEHLPLILSSGPWPVVIFGVEIMIAVVLGAWFALEGISSATPRGHTSPIPFIGGTKRLEE